MKDENISLKVTPLGTIEGEGKEFPVFNITGEPVEYKSFDELNGVRIHVIDPKKSAISVLKDGNYLNFYIRECFDIIYLSDVEKEDDHHRLFIEDEIAFEILGEKLKLKSKGYYKEEDISKDLPGFVTFSVEGSDNVYHLSGDDGYIFIQRDNTMNPVFKTSSPALYGTMFCKHVVKLD